MNLSRIELFFYYSTCFVFVFYGIYRVHHIGQFFKHNVYHEDFEPGWLWKNSKKDVSDHEWNYCLEIIKHIYPWIFINLIVAECIRYINIKFLPAWYIIFTTLYCCELFGYIPTISLYLQPITFFIIISFTKSSLIIWAVGFIFLIFINSVTYEGFIELSYIHQYYLIICQSWIYLKCLSFSLDIINNQAPKSFISILGYCFYLPTFTFGPVILYSTFYNGLTQNYEIWNKERIFKFIFGLLRYSFWILFVEIWLHLIYSNALSFQPDILPELDSWTLYGLGYCLGQFFMLKYTVMYGLSCLFTSTERYSAPNPPKCIGRIHLYSDMWRTFDQGLYLFLQRYIYVPVVKDKKNDLFIKFYGSLCCFSFVYLWHGLRLYIFIWAFLNFIGIIIEGFAKHLNRLTYEYQIERLGPIWIKRFHALLASPLLFMSALSNFYFFAGTSTGHVFIIRSLKGFASYSSWIVLFYLYCVCNISVHYKSLEISKEKLLKNQ